MGVMEIIYDEEWFGNNAKDFDKWFDPEKFDWRQSYYLAKYCPEHFDVWFDKETFNFQGLKLLAKYCSEHFNKWFDKETLETLDGLFYKLASENLCIFCSEHCDKWFVHKKFNWTNKDNLKKNCIKYIDTWYTPAIFEETYQELIRDYTK